MRSAGKVVYLQSDPHADAEPERRSTAGTVFAILLTVWFLAIVGLAVAEAMGWDVEALL